MPKTVGELRASTRQAYGYRQRIAPMFGSRVPAPERFYEVLCGDISGGGISFYLDHRPEFDELVVALGQPPEVIYVAGRVAHVKPVVRGGAVMFRVGCSFSHRVST